MSYIVPICSFVCGLALAFGLLLFSIKPRCRVCEQNIALANLAEGKSKVYQETFAAQVKLIDRLLVSKGIPQTEKSEAALKQDEEEKAAEDERTKILAAGGEIYGD